MAFRNAVANAFGLLKPSVRPISVTETARSASSSLACSMRRLVWYRCGGVPRDCLNARQKCHGLRRTSCASVASDTRSVEMFLNIGSDDPLLPGCKATSDLRLNAGYPAIETHDFMYEQGTEGFKIEPVS